MSTNRKHAVREQVQAFIRLEDNVPFVKKKATTKSTKQRKPRESKYPFATMEVSQSFILPFLTSAYQSHAKATGKKFAVRQDGAYFRYWRLK
jgi:hypothetical protein